VPGVLLGDPVRLRQVLINVLGNAVKFTEAGHVLLRVSAEGPAHMRIEVCDTGIGISEDGRERLFEPFAQADGSTTRRFGGTGLGLSISRQLVELMGGRIGFESELGKGTNFTITLPLERAGIDEAPEVPPAVRGNRLVLLAGCGPAQRELLESELAELRLGVRLLESDQDYAQAANAALAIVDLGPGSAGSMDAVRKLRELAPKVPIIVLASVRHRSARRGARDAGAAAVVTRPVRRDDLRQAVARVLEGTPDAALPMRGSLIGVRTPAKSGGRVLLAEDNLVNQKVAARMLERLGFSVDVAGDGRAALDLYERGRYALVLLDCQMPVLDGYETAQALRRHERQGYGSHVPIVALTANAMAEDRARCLSAGMDDYLSKPVRLEDLRETMTRWLGVQPQAAQPPQP
jgi:two-component system, sensor histidine kinase and response regulator